MPKVSVIIPNYNHASYLERRIQSVLDQTYQDFEIIYLDDASTDSSNSVIADFLDHPKIQAVYNETNSGSPFKQWNKGIQLAQGEYIWIAESDDYASPKLLEELVSRLDDYPNVGVAYCQSWLADENSQLISSLEKETLHLDELRWKRDFVSNGRDECRQYLVFQNTIPNASAVLFRKSLYEKIGGADEDLRLSGDWLVWIKMLLISDIAFVSQPLNYFRSHEKSVRSNSFKNGLLLREYFQVINYIQSNVNVSTKKLDQVFENLLNKWYGCSIHHQWSWLDNLNIYRIFFKVDNRLNQRILQKFFRRLVKTMQKPPVFLA